MNKHTPGPWQYGPSKGRKWFVYGAVNKPIYVRNVSATNRSPKENEANDRFIAAAPEMLEALERIIEVSKTIPAIRGGSLTGAECRALDQAQSAVNKAKGDTQ